MAVPFQGFASATMLACASDSSMSVALDRTTLTVHNAAIVGDQTGELSEHCRAMAASAHDHAGKSKPGHDASAKCKVCAACHVGAAFMSSGVNRIQVNTQQFTTVPFDLGAVAVVDLALPERPPQA